MGSKSIRGILEIVSNLEMRKKLNRIIEQVNNGEIISEELVRQVNAQRQRDGTNFIQQKAPNISNEATECLVCHLIQNRVIFKEITQIHSVERKGHKKGEDGGADILVNGSIKVEVKGTSVKRDITTKAKSNANVYALVWVETEDWMNNKAEHINVTVFKNPQGIEVEYLKSNGENKIRLHESKEIAKLNGLAQEYKVNPHNLFEEYCDDNDFITQERVSL